MFHQLEIKLSHQDEKGKRLQWKTTCRKQIIVLQTYAATTLKRGAKFTSIASLNVRIKGFLEKELFTGQKQNRGKMNL